MDWACSALTEGGSAPKLQRRGDFQASEVSGFEGFEGLRVLRVDGLGFRGFRV